jgi:hypothetical protein
VGVGGFFNYYCYYYWIYLVVGEVQTWHGISSTVWNKEGKERQKKITVPLSFLLQCECVVVVPFSLFLSTEGCSSNFSRVLPSACRVSLPVPILLLDLPL